MLIFSQEGEVEVLSPQCSLPITTFSKFGGIGRTAAMTDEEILLLGNDDMGVSRRYISIQKPREGLLAMKYTVEDLPLTQSQCVKGGGSEKCFFLRQPKVCFGHLGQVIECSTLRSTFQ